jgi:hypothetical protein
VARTSKIDELLLSRKTNIEDVDEGDIVVVPGSGSGEKVPSSLKGRKS